MSSKRKTTCYLQVNHPKIISRFFSRNFAGQEWHNIVKILGEKNKKPPTMYTQQSYHSETKERQRVLQASKS